ncbi:hypothetical protein [Synechococcus phage BUCT-ZZ01]|nr:hypothetical protein [Synechococcus phage BUCT-ZZ01]
MSTNPTRITRICLKSKNVTDIFAYWIEKVEEINQSGKRFNYWYELRCPYGIVQKYKYLHYAESFLDRIFA